MRARPCLRPTAWIVTGAPFGTALNPIRAMQGEHEAVGDLLAFLRALTEGYTPPPDACNTFRGLYHGLREMERELQEHIHLENNVQFPRLIRLEEEVQAPPPRG